MGRAQLDSELKPRHFLKYLFTSKLRRFDVNIKKVPQIKDLKLLFEAVFKDKPVPDKKHKAPKSEHSSWNFCSYIELFLKGEGSKLKAFTVHFYMRGCFSCNSL